MCSDSLCTYSTVQYFVHIVLVRVFTASKINVSVLLQYTEYSLCVIQKIEIGRIKVLSDTVVVFKYKTILLC